MTLIQARRHKSFGQVRTASYRRRMSRLQTLARLRCSLFGATNEQIRGPSPVHAAARKVRDDWRNLCRRGRRYRRVGHRPPRVRTDGVVRCLRTWAARGRRRRSSWSARRRLDAHADARQICTIGPTCASIVRRSTRSGAEPGDSAVRPTSSRSSDGPNSSRPLDPAGASLPARQDRSAAYSRPRAPVQTPGKRRHPARRHGYWKLSH